MQNLLSGNESSQNFISSINFELIPVIWLMPLGVLMLEELIVLNISESSISILVSLHSVVFTTASWTGDFTKGLVTSDLVASLSGSTSAASGEIKLLLAFLVVWWTDAGVTDTEINLGIEISICTLSCLFFCELLMLTWFLTESSFLWIS